MSKWFLSRQCYWGVEYDERLVVEIAGGGCDYANADMLSDPGGEYYRLGCDQEYTDPREALKAAILVRDKWKELDPGEEIRIEHGHTGGYTMPFMSFPTDEDLQKWADAAYAKLEKCIRCGEIIVGNYFYNLGDPDLHLCSEYCAERAMADYEMEED